MGETNNKQVDNANGLAILMSIYNSMEYSNNYSQILRDLWHFVKIKQIIKF